MTTIAIVGAGRGLGAAIARRFGAEGLDIALISRNQERLDALATDLADKVEREQADGQSIEATHLVSSAVNSLQ